MWFTILKKPSWYKESNPYKPKKDKKFQYMADLTPDWDDTLTWESKDKKARGEATYHESFETGSYMWNIRVFTIKEEHQGKGNARKYLKEFIEELDSLEYTNSPPSVSKIKSHTLKFWEKMKEEGLVSDLQKQ